MTLPRVHNETDFVAEPHVLLDGDGEKLCAIVKATFELARGQPRGDDGSFTIAPKPRRRGVRAADVPWGKPEISSVRYPADLCVRKPGTEVVVVAQAHAPGGLPAPRFDAAVRVGSIGKTVRVTGPRVFLPDDGGVSDPTEIASLVLRYEYAFGGTDASRPDHFAEDPRNPIGRGFAVDPKSLGGKPAPQIEDPAEPIGAPSKRPKPAGLGPLGRHWEPRRGRWGTYGPDWLRRRSPLPPTDFDERANVSAPEGLWAQQPLRGGEEGALTNLTPSGGVVPFRLPTIRLTIGFRIKGRDPIEVSPPLDTVVLDTVLVAPPRLDGSGTAAWASPLTLELVMRASAPAPLKWSSGEIVVEERRG